MVCKHPHEYSPWWHKNKNIIHTYFSFLHYKFRKLQKDEIDILLELGQLENIFNPQEQLIFK
jgi:hypothetical protein